MHAFAVNKILMYSNIMAPKYQTAKDAANAITQLQSDQFSQIFNETNGKLNDWINIAIQVNTQSVAMSAPTSTQTASAQDEVDNNAQNVNIRKTFYENQSIQYLYNWNKLLHLIYYFLAICLVISLFLYIIINQISAKTAFYFMPTRLWQFMLGILAFNIGKKINVAITIPA